MKKKPRFAGGEKAEIIGNHSLHNFPIGKIVNVAQYHCDKRYNGEIVVFYNCCDENGDCYYVRETNLKKINKGKMTNQMKKAVFDTANKLLSAQNTVTTLEIKSQALVDHSNFFWTQQFVSDTMNEFYQDGLFTFTDNGTYRIYSAVNASAAISLTSAFVPAVSAIINVTKPTLISRKKAYELMTNNKGHFFTATFIDKKDKERIMNCQYMKSNQDTLTLGYIKVRESNKLKSGDNPIRQINLQTLKSLKIAGSFYKIRK